ncbi:MAG: hypothetical protein ACTHVY_00625 [Brevibacterium yomogidense]
MSATIEEQCEVLPSGIAEALERVARMGAAPGLVLGDIRRERMEAALSSSAPMSTGPFRVFAVMVHESSLGEGGALTYERGRGWLAIRAGMSDASVKKQLKNLRESGFLIPLRYGGWNGDENQTGIWGFTTPEESGQGDVYEHAERWWRMRGTTAAEHHRRDFRTAMIRLYGDDVLIPEWIPEHVEALGDLVAWVSYLRQVHRK